MQVTLKAQFQKYIDEQVRTGRFASPDEAIEAGVARLMSDPQRDALDAEDRAAITESLAQIEVGQLIDARMFGEEPKRKFPIKQG